MITSMWSKIPHKQQTVQEQIDFFMRPKECTCSSCVGSAKFATIINKLDSDDDKKWMLAFLDFAYERDEELGMERDYARHLNEELSALSQQNLALQKVAEAVDGVGPINANIGNWLPLWDAMAAARDAGALKNEEVGP